MQPARRRSNPKLMLHEDDADEDVEDVDVEDEADADADIDDDDEPVAELDDELDIDAIAAAPKLGGRQRKSSPGAALLSCWIWALYCMCSGNMAPLCKDDDEDEDKEDESKYASCKSQLAGVFVD